MQCNYLTLALAIEDEPLGATSALQAALTAAGARRVSVELPGDQRLVVAFELGAARLPALLELLRRRARVLGEADAAVRRLVYELQPDVEVHGELHVSLVQGG